MSELSFLIELLLNHDLKKETKDAIASRIKEVEQKMLSPMQVSWAKPPQPIPAGVQQAPSTLALMAKHGEALIYPPPIVETPVTQIAQTPAAQAALAARNEAINKSTSSKPLNADPGPGRKSPRKW